MFDKEIAIYSLNVTKKLVKEGFQIINIGHNNTTPGMLVFYFENTETLRRELFEKHNIIIDN